MEVTVFVRTGLDTIRSVWLVWDDELHMTIQQMVTVSALMDMMEERYPRLFPVCIFFLPSFAFNYSYYV
jgi:hypothetical protein